LPMSSFRKLELVTHQWDFRRDRHGLRVRWMVERLPQP
jgi:hypothetical protein